MPKQEIILARLVHTLLFLSMIAMPITGYLMSAYANKTIPYFDLIHIPMLVQPDKTMAHLFHDIHAYMSYAIIALVSLHVLGALKHHFIDRNNILIRMLPFGR